jgi:hypothetical protein
MGSAPEAHPPLAENPTSSEFSLVAVLKIKGRHLVARIFN